MWIPKPETIHANKDILQCYEALVCGYLAAFETPYHWLFADSWGFYYQSISRYGAYEPACVYPLWRNLNQIYGVRKRLFHDASLHDLASRIAADGEPLFLVVDQYDLPWVTEYGMLHHNHFLLVSEVSANRERLRIQDLWPIEFRDWYAFDAIDKAYHARGGNAFQISPPAFRFDAVVLCLQLKNGLDKMKGEETELYSSGLIGLQKFYSDIAAVGDQAFAQAEHCFDMLRRVVDVRFLFVEFLCYLQQLTAWRNPHTSGLIAAVEQCITAWHALRNYIVLSSLKQNYARRKGLALLEKIIDHEQACLKKTEALLRYYEQAL